MSVLATVGPGAAAGAAELQAVLASARVVFLVDPAGAAELAAALADPKYTTVDELIGRGQPAVAGKDGYFEPAFHVGIQPGHISEQGTMDFFDRELLKPLAQDEYAGQLHAPVPGVNGRRVDGVEIKVAPVRPSKLRIGPNLRMASDGRVYAAQPGVVIYVPEKTLDIVQQHLHRGDVDLRSGSLEMQGSLIVGGTVQRLFFARATGDVEVQGGVESGSVYSTKAIRIRGGVRGGESGMVCAEGNVSARNAEGAHMLCGGTLKLDTAINSELCAVKIEIARVVRGGAAQSESSLTVRDAGAAHGGATLLAAGVPLPRPLLDVQRALATSKEQRQMQRSAGGVRGPSERPKGGKVGRAQLRIEGEQLAHKVVLAERRQELLPSARIDILGTGHLGVVIQIGTHSLVLDKLTSNARFSYDPQTRGIRTERPVR